MPARNAPKNGLDAEHDAHHADGEHEYQLEGDWAPPPDGVEPRLRGRPVDRSADQKEGRENGDRGDGVVGEIAGRCGLEAERSWKAVQRRAGLGGETQGHGKDDVEDDALHDGDAEHDSRERGAEQSQVEHFLARTRASMCGLFAL